MSKRILRMILPVLIAVFSSIVMAVGVETANTTGEAGFETIEPVEFYFHFGSYFDRLAQRSAEAKIWYVYQPADSDPDNQPLFVFFNGGPGSATSSGLLSMYTSRYTLDNTLESGGSGFMSNPVSWTRMGNLLYIDARTAGFSYSLMQEPDRQDYRQMEFNSQNYNGYIDAGDFIRVILRFLRRNPELQDNPVVIVGESYGGARAAILLHILLRYRDFANGTYLYQDPALVEEIQTHYNSVFPAYQGMEVPPEVIAGQFGHQVLVQPAVIQYYQGRISNEILSQPGSVLYQLAEDLGLSYDPVTYPSRYTFIQDVARRDAYNISRPVGWLNGFFGNAGELLQQPENLSLVTGMDVRRITDLYASARTNAYKRVYVPAAEPSTEEPEWDDEDYLNFRILARQEAARLPNAGLNMAAVFGILRPWDLYFIGSNGDANNAFHYISTALIRSYPAHPYDRLVGWMAVWNMAHVETFITNAAYDLVVYTPALPRSLAEHSELVESVRTVTSGNPEVERPEHIIMRLRQDVFPELPDLDRTIRFPSYSKSCHAVSLTEPSEFFQDVWEWLDGTGLLRRR